MSVEKKRLKLLCRSIEVVEVVWETLDGVWSIVSSDATDTEILSVNILSERSWPAVGETEDMAN